MEEVLRKQIEKIVPLTDEEFRFVMTHFTAKTVKKHQYLIQAGYPAPNDHFVTNGLLKSFYMDELGKTHILQFAIERFNQFVQLYPTLLQRVPKA